MRSSSSCAAADRLARHGFGARAALQLVVALVVALAATAPAGVSAQDPRSGYITVGEDRLWFEEAGSGPAVLLLHDGLVHSAGMDDLFHALAPRFRVIRYDRRGYGRSDTPSDPYSPVADAVAVLDQLEVEGAVVIGASAGGGGAVELALDYPDRVRGLVLLGAVVNGYGYSEHFIERGRRNSAPLAERDYRGAMRNWLEDRWLVAPGNDEARERAWALVEPLAEKHLTNPSRLAQRPPRPAAARLHEIRVPALLVLGESDIPDVHAHAGVLEAGIEDSRRVVVEGAGHLVFLERPEEVSRLVLEFLEEIGEP